MLTLNNDPQARNKKQEARTLPVLASCFLFLACVAHAQDAQTLVSQMQGAERSVSYSAIQKGQGGTARVFRSGLKRRLEWLEGIRRGDVLVDDGQHVTLYHRAEHSATQTDSRPRVSAFVPSGAATKTRFAGRSAFSIPISGGRTVVIDAQTKILLSNGGSGSSLSDIRFGSVPAAKFTFTPPPGVIPQKFDGVLYVFPGPAKRAARWLKMPSQLPSGWKFESAIVGPSSAWLRYSNGQHRFSLFEQPTTDTNLPPQPVEGGTFWKSGGVRILATGSPQSALNQVVNDLK